MTELENTARKRNYFDRKKSVYIDSRMNEWKFLDEVKDSTHFRTLSKQHGVKFLQGTKAKEKSRSVCVQQNWFKRSNGHIGFACPYRLLFLRPNIQQMQRKEALFGYIFHRGKHSHPFISGSQVNMHQCWYEVL